MIFLFSIDYFTTTFALRVGRVHWAERERARQLLGLSCFAWCKTPGVSSWFHVRQVTLRHELRGTNPFGFHCTRVRHSAFLWKCIDNMVSERSLSRDMRDIVGRSDDHCGITDSFLFLVGLHWVLYDISQLIIGVRRPITIRSNFSPSLFVRLSNSLSFFLRRKHTNW